MALFPEDLEENFWVKKKFNNIFLVQFLLEIGAIFIKKVLLKKKLGHKFYLNDYIKWSNNSYSIMIHLIYLRVRPVRKENDY